MKKKLVPVLVVLALIAVGVGGYFIGQQSNDPTVENPPAESSTPEVKTEPSVEPVADTAIELSTPQEQPFKETLYTVYVKNDYLKNGSGVPVWDKYKVDASLGINGLQKEVFKTSANAGVPYVVVGVGYGDADGYLQILDISSGATGYSNENWFTQELAEVEVQKPAEQKPAEQKPAEQKPAEQKPANDGAGIDPSQLGEHYSPENSDRTTIPEEDQIHDGGESGWSKDGTIGGKYTGRISG